MAAQGDPGRHHGAARRWRNGRACTGCHRTSRPGRANDEPINPVTAVTDQRAYIEAFFGKYLRDRDSRLLDGPSPRFPDISFES